MGQGKEGIEGINFALKCGKLDLSVLPYLEEAQLIEITGWTPKELDEQDAERIGIYEVIWGAKGTQSRNERRELR